MLRGLLSLRPAARSTDWRSLATSHFLGQGQQPTGATQLKRRQLRALGWAVVPVPYFEWNRLRGVEAKQDYLRARLASVGREAGEAEPPAPPPGQEEGPLGWNAFQQKWKGRGLSREEVRQRYRAQRAGG